MASFEIQWKSSARRELRRLSREVILKILNAIESLADNPFPHGSRKLTGSENEYRIRVGEYRVIYIVEASRLIIDIIRVGHRGEVYRN